MERTTVRIKPHLHQKAKVFAATKGISFQQVVNMGLAKLLLDNKEMDIRQKLDWDKYPSFSINIPKGFLEKRDNFYPPVEKYASSNK